MSYAFLLPAVLIFLVFKYYPIALTFILSVQKLSLEGSTWVGSANFQHFLLDSDAHHALFITFKAMLIGLVVGIPLAFLLALLLSFDTRLKGFFRTAFFIPYITPAIATVYVWKLLFTADFGTIAQLFRALGLKSPGFLADINMALYVVIAYGVWKSAGYTMLIYLASLDGLDTAYYEAARIDGAGFFRYVRSVLIPILSPITSMLIVLGVIGGLKSFISAFLLTSGGPSDATMFYGLYVYYAAFRNFQYSYAAALGLILLLIIATVTVAQWRNIRASI